MRARPRRRVALVPLLAAGIVLIGMGSTASAQSARRLEFHLHAGMAIAFWCRPRGQPRP